MSDLYKGYIAGCIGRVAELHAQYYAKHWNFGVFFEAKVAAELSEFMTHYDAKQDAFWAIVKEGRLEGAITVDGSHAHSEGAHLRWFILSDKLRGQGFGKQLMAEAITFCQEKKYSSVYLWTFAGLGAARKLYEDASFELVHEQIGEQWGTEVTEQKFVLKLSESHYAN